MNLDESLAADDELADLEWEGHVVGDVWQVRLKGRVVLIEKSIQLWVMFGRSDSKEISF